MPGLEQLMEHIPGGVYYPGDEQRLREDLVARINAPGDGLLNHMINATEPFLWSNIIDGFTGHIELQKPASRA